MKLCEKCNSPLWPDFNGQAFPCGRCAWEAEAGINLQPQPNTGRAAVSNAEILTLIARLARATAEWRGGHYDGASYTDARWRSELEAIAKEAERAALPQEASR